MLDNTFDEEYFRLENTINTNDISFTKDREGRLILTLPYLDDPRIVSDNLVFTGANIDPENVNLIVDSIDLFSTNPECQNYLPLRISFSQKPIIEYTDVTFTQLDNFKLIRNPVTIWETVYNHRYTKPTYYSFDPKTLEDEPPLDFTVDVGLFTNFNSKEKIIVTLFEDEATDIRQLCLNYVESKKVEYLTVNDFENCSNLNYIFTNGTNGYVVGVDLDDEIAIYDLTELYDSITPYNNLLQATPITPKRLINLVITGFYTFTICYDDALDDGIVAILGYNIDQNESLLYTQYAFDDFKVIAFNSFYTNKQAFYYKHLGVYKLNLIITDTYSTDASYGSPSINTVIDRQLSIESETIKGVYLGGQDIDRPIFVLLDMPLSGENIIKFYIYSDYDALVEKQIIPLAPIAPLAPTSTVVVKTSNINTVYSIPKQYLNQVYFTVTPDNTAPYEPYIYIFNLSTFKLFTWSLTDLYPQRVLPRSMFLNQIVDFSPYYQLVGGMLVSNDLFGNDVKKVNIVAFANSRPIDSVYKMSYNYVERTYPFQLSGNRLTFTITLPFNVPISDMEIFRYAVDIRIRYSKTKTVVNKALPAEEDNVGAVSTLDTKSGRGIKTNRKVGDVERVLGYVGDDFSIADFLNLYTTK